MDTAHRFGFDPKTHEELGEPGRQAFLGQLRGLFVIPRAPKRDPPPKPHFFPCLDPENRSKLQEAARSWHYTPTRAPGINGVGSCPAPSNSASPGPWLWGWLPGGKGKGTRRKPRPPWLAGGKLVLEYKLSTSTWTSAHLALASRLQVI